MWLKIESLIQAAHIYPVASIRKRTDLSDEKKLEFAVDRDNGIWLCENHHKLFDRGLIWFDENCNLVVSPDVQQENFKYLKYITTIDKIEPRYINDKMMQFFHMRKEVMEMCAYDNGQYLN